MTFQTDPFLCPNVKKSQIFFCSDVQNQYFSVRTLNFVLKRSTIGPIMHKNAIKHEKIGFWDVFRRRMGFRLQDFGLRGKGVSTVGFPTDVRLVHPCRIG